MRSDREDANLRRQLTTGNALVRSHPRDGRTRPRLFRGGMFSSAGQVDGAIPALYDHERVIHASVT